MLNSMQRHYLLQIKYWFKLNGYIEIQKTDFFSPTSQTKVRLEI